MEQFMRFDVNHSIVTKSSTIPYPQALDNSRRAVERYEELGFDGVWFGEHHFDIPGVDAVPNPIQLATDMAARTSRIRLGTAAIIMPMWHPIRIAEDLAALDQYSGGRVDAGFARGITPAEFLTFDPTADRSNEARSRAIFEENLQIVQGLWNQDRFSWHSERFDIPAKGVSMRQWDEYADFHDANGHLEAFTLVPKPLQQHIPVYQMTQKAPGARESVRLGMGVVTSHATGERIAPLNAAYKEASEEFGAPRGVSRSVTVVRDFCIAETAAEARKIAYDYVHYRFETIRRVRGIGEWLNPGEDPEDPKILATDPYDIMVDRDTMLVGTVDSVTEQLVRLSRTHEIDHWLFAADRIGGAADARSLELLATEVLPAVRRQLDVREPGEVFA
jgi:alkanesulfonate monooxygenase SsuD/methylene tetrahydromethanopterin reductase-like flavin-dependent oxidoreductase (luciferase family)